MNALTNLLAEIQAEARREPFPVDTVAYDAAGRRRLEPILLAGALDARIASLGRDLGRDEVRWAEPQVGAAGQLVRKGCLTSRGIAPPAEDPLRREALQYLLLTNTVPYKPPGNVAYRPAVRERFRPFVAELLGRIWSGEAILTLGTEAFRWFEPYAEPQALDALWDQEDRYERELSCRLPGPTGSRSVVVCPLPHPSPLNRRWLARFPDLLAARLARWG